MHALGHRHHVKDFLAQLEPNLDTELLGEKMSKTSSLSTSQLAASHLTFSL